MSARGELRTAHPDLNTEWADIHTLRPHPANPRNGDTDAIADSLRAHGQFRPIVTTTDGTILAGNHTYAAAMQLGWTNIAVVRLPIHPDSPDAISVMLADNRTADLGTYDDGILLNLLESLNGDTIGTGYDTDDINHLRKLLDIPTDNDPDLTPALRGDKPTTRTGDLWQLSPHRLHVADSTTPEAHNTALGDDRIDLILTDPPYGVDYVGKTADALTIDNDQTQGLERFLTEAFTHARHHCRPGAVFYTFAPSGAQLLAHRLAVRDAGLEVRVQIAWVKDRFVLGHRDFHARHEAILYGWVEGPHTYNGGRDKDDVWEFDRPAASREHPTMKPVAMLEHAITLSSNPGDIVYDFFGGSGSTLIAAEITGRNARLIEKDPQYADVICRRYQEFTGILPTNNGEPHDFCR